MKENCQNILKKKKKREREKMLKKKNKKKTQTVQRLSCFFSVWVWDPSVWASDFLGKKSSFMIFTGYCIFTDFLQSAWGTHSTFWPEVLSHKIQKEKKKTKQEKKINPLCEFKRNLDLGAGETFVMFAHLSFPLETGSPIWPPSVVT